VEPNGSDEPRRASGSSRADGSIALLGSPSATKLRRGFRTPWCRINHGPPCLAFVLPDRHSDSVGVKIVSATNSFSEPVNLVDD
jgi:hypothetical protein